MTRSASAELVWSPNGSRPGWRDLLAILAWTLAIAAFFWDAVSLRKALFYFDITEINYPYRDFLASELKLGRFSRWMPGLYCGLPLYSESQAGYLHPLKYFFYPWLATWQALNLDTIGSIWLAGLGAYGWLRRHVGAVGSLTGAATFALGGFTWAHLIHTSMTNALISVPIAFWALEVTWDGGRLRGMVVAALAIACQVFAGHLQDVILTGSALGVYGLYRAATESRGKARFFVVSTTIGALALGVLISAVQWIPSKELLDRSPRAGGLTYEKLTFGSWHPELLPTLLVREAYGTRARDTDWMDGFYPYHEMNAYLGVVGLALAVVGLAAYRDRWVGFWVLLGSLGGILMLGRFTAVFDVMPMIPIVGKSRIPVRYHLWVTLAVSALASVGADRLARPGKVGLRGAWITIGILVSLAIPIAIAVYWPAFGETKRWNTDYHRARRDWLSRELVFAIARSAFVLVSAAAIARWASRRDGGSARASVAAVLPVLVLIDLLGSHWRDVPTIAPTYWTKPPASVAYLKSDPGLSRVFGISEFSAGEPGYASPGFDERRFFRARETLSWSLAPGWGLSSSAGETPIHPMRINRYGDASLEGGGRFDIEGVSHFLVGWAATIPGWSTPVRVGSAYISRNPRVLPRARLVGRPIYVKDENEAVAAMETLKPGSDYPLVVEDPDRPIAASAEAAGTARIVDEEPERVVIRAEVATPCYLVLADSFDPGWSATVDNQPSPIRPAYVAFRAVFLGKGPHVVVFQYSPAGFRAGLYLSIAGGLGSMILLGWPRRPTSLAPAHGDPGWPTSWPAWLAGGLIVIVAGSALTWKDGRPALQERWSGSFHSFTWGSGIEAMQLRRSKPVEESLGSPIPASKR